jgi:hypothetical protein
MKSTGIRLHLNETGARSFAPSHRGSCLRKEQLVAGAVASRLDSIRDRGGIKSREVAQLLDTPRRPSRTGAPARSNHNPTVYSGCPHSSGCAIMLPRLVDVHAQRTRD